MNNNINTMNDNLMCDNSNSYITELGDILNSNQQCDYLYISIGSKFNEPNVNIDNKLINTNIYYQQIPSFIRSKPLEKRVISIMIDTFNTENEILKAQQILHNISKTIPNIRNYIINKFCNVEVINNIIPLIISFIHKLNIPSENFMICNYIKFIGQPNNLEQISEKTISSRIHTLLNTTPYEYCLYEWFGYHKSLYHYIFNYKKSKIIHQFNQYVHICLPIIDKIYYINNLDDILQNNNIRPIILKKVLSCVFNIISQNQYDTNIACSLYDEIITNNTEYYSNN